MNTGRNTWRNGASSGWRRALLLLPIVYLPLWLGGVETGARVLFLVSVFLVLAVSPPREFCSSARRFTPFGLAAALAGLGAFQIVPLAPRMVHAVSPMTAELYSKAFAALGPLIPGDAGRWHPLSLHIHATAGAVLFLAAFAAWLLLVRDEFSPGGIERLAGPAVVFGFLVAVEAIVQRAAWNGKVLWLFDVAADRRPLGPFVNRNHFAAFLLPCLFLGLGKVMSRSTPGRQKPLFGFFSTVMLLSLMLSLSRGGTLGFVAGIVALLGLLLAFRRGTRGHVALALVVVAGAAAAFYAASERIIGRYAELRTAAQTESVSFRLSVWRSTIAMARDFPLAGVGLGCFRDAFPAYQRVDAPVVFSHPENEFLELLAETGALGLLWLVWVLARAGRLARSLRNQSTVALAAAAGCAATAFQQLFDFGLHIPGVAVMFGLSLVVAFGHPGRDERGPAGGGPDPEADGRAAHGRVWRSAAAVAGLFLLAAVALRYAGAWECARGGSAARNFARTDGGARHLGAAAAHLARSEWLDPTSSECRLAAAGALSGIRRKLEGEGGAFGLPSAEALDGALMASAAQAVRLNPAGPDAWFGLGRASEITGDQRRALDCMTTYRELAPSWPWAAFELGRVRLLRGHDRSASRMFRKAISRDPLIMEDVFREYDRRGRFPAEWSDLLGRRRDLFARAAVVLERSGLWEESARLRRQAAAAGDAQFGRRGDEAE